MSASFIPSRGWAPALNQRPNLADADVTVREADLTVRVADFAPMQGNELRALCLRLLIAHRIGTASRVNVSLDKPQQPATALTMPYKLWLEKRAPPRSDWLSSTAFLVFKSRERTLRAQAMLDGLKVDGAILSAKVLGRGGVNAAVENVRAVCHCEESAEETLDLVADFPALPAPGPMLVPVATVRPAMRAATGSSADASSSVARSEASTMEPICSYCKQVGHVARVRGVVCCPKLFHLECVRAEAREAKAKEEVEQRMARALDRSVARKLRQRKAELEAEQTGGWVTVGGTALLSEASPAVQTPALEPSAKTPDGSVEASHELSRSQKRMQKRKEKSRAARAALRSQP